jgi:mono/diheme cytochrome c family protein
MQDSGAILAFTYEREGAPVEAPVVSQVKPGGGAAAKAPPTAVVGGIPPQFTAAQATAGRTAYNANCAVCHGNTMTNGTMGTPLAGEYFKTEWTGRTVGALFEKSHKTMPPAAPASLPRDTYAAIVAYILEVNGFKAGIVALPPGGESADKMVIK